MRETFTPRRIDFFRQGALANGILQDFFQKKFRTTHDEWFGIVRVGGGLRFDSKPVPGQIAQALVL